MINFHYFDLNGRCSNTLFNLVHIIAEDLQKKEVPEAYLICALYDEDSNRYEVGKKVLTRNAANQHEELEEKLAIKKNGYIETFVVNETGQDVWFDNLRLLSTGSLLVQETHYDPWGLELTGLGFQYGGIKANKYLYNGKELIEDNGLQYYDYGARMYDPAIGRWGVLDPMASEREWVSPYNFVQNNPLSRIDPDGRLDDYFNREGKYLGSDEAKTDFVRIVDQEAWDANKRGGENARESILNETGSKITNVLSESGISLESALAVYSHYNDTGLKTEIVSEPGSNMASFKYTVRGGNVFVGKEKLSFNNQALTREKVSDHASEIRNIIVHEGKHYSDYTSMGPDNYYQSRETTIGANGRERRAVNAQVLDQSFSLTRKSFQKGVIRYGESFGYISPIKTTNKQLP